MIGDDFKWCSYQMIIGYPRNQICGGGRNLSPSLYAGAYEGPNSVSIEMRENL